MIFEFFGFEKSKKPLFLAYFGGSYCALLRTRDAEPEPEPRSRSRTFFAGAGAGVAFFGPAPAPDKV